MFEDADKVTKDVLLLVDPAHLRYFSGRDSLE